MSMDRVERQKDHFDRISHRYLEGRSGKNHLAYKEVIWEYILRGLVGYLPSDREIAGLEAMCGNAEAAERLADRFPRLKMAAFDLSDSMAAAAQGKEGGRIRVFREDILRFREKEAYDLAVVIGGLHHIPHDVREGLRNIYGALKKGGLFLNLEPTHNNFLFRAVRERIYRANAIFEESSERAFTLREYNANLGDTGFRVLCQCYPGLLGYVLYYNPDAFPALNIGPAPMARFLARFDLALGRTFIGRKFSFATLTMAEKP